MEMSRDVVFVKYNASDKLKYNTSDELKYKNISILVPNIIQLLTSMR